MPGRIDQSDVDKIRDATDLVALIAEHVSLHPKGREHVGLCPFHDDHKPSLTVVTHKDNAFYKCHSCGQAGNAVNFVMEYHKMSFPEALRHLADRAGIQLTARTDRTGEDSGASAASLRKANSLAASFFGKVLRDPEHGATARSAISDRKINDEMVEAFGLGAAPAEWDGLARRAQTAGVSIESLAAGGLVKPRSKSDGHYDVFRNRLIFPICDELGRTIAFGGRQLDPDDEPKYLNSAESSIFHKSRTLYGLHMAKRAIIDSKQAIVAEGYTDVIACHQAGINNVVATLGTALTRDHVRLLKRLCDVVVLLFDGDTAGQRAADRAVEHFFAESVDIKICILPDGSDPDDILRQEAGAERLRNEIAAANDALPYVTNQFRRELKQTDGPAAKHRCLERFMNKLVDLGWHNMPGVRRRLTSSDLSHWLGVPINDIERAVPRQRRVSAPSVTTDSSTLESSVVPQETGAAVLPARMRAERDLLAILIHSPDLRAQTVSATDGELVTVTKRFNAGAFRDPSLQGLAKAVFGRLDGDTDFTVQDLMSELESPDDRRLVSDLYEQTQAQDDQPTAPCTAERLQAACAALNKVESDESYREELAAYHRGSRDTANDDALREQIKKRREQGDLPAVMPLRVRS